MPLFQRRKKVFGAKGADIMRFVLTCGGSGGHINPALAVAQKLRKEGHEILFIGAPQGLERDLVPREGFPIEFVEIRALSHSLKPKAILKNMGVLFQMATATKKTKKILKNFAPNAILGTGGYASFPALYAGAKLKIPVLVHESNAIPGITTRRIAPHATAILVGQEACRKHYKQKEKVRVVGTPVRPEFFEKEKDAPRGALGLDSRPVVVSIFGSQGAGDMNRLILELWKEKEPNWQHIHAAGAKAYASLKESAKEKRVNIFPASGLRLVDYIHNMAETLAAADVIVCRAGASTLAELTAAGKSAILIPSPNVVADHQTKNAKVLEEAGGAILLPEDRLTVEKLYGAVEKLLADEAKRKTMSRVLKNLSVPDSAQKIADIMKNKALQ